MKQYSNEIKNLVCQLKLSGFSLSEISEKLQIPNSTISNWLQKNNQKSITHPLYKTHKIKHDYFSDENLKNFPHRFIIIGFIAADGCIYETTKGKGQNRLCFNISSKDIEILNIINKEICDGTRKIGFNKKTNSSQVYFPSNQICKDLAKYNIVPRKTSIYQLPKLNDKQMAYFIRGYFYGDGCVYGKNSARIYHLIGNNLFCMQLSEYLVSNKVVDRCNVFPIKNSRYMQIHMKGRQGAKFSKYIFFDNLLNLLPRKHIISEEIVYGSRWTIEELELVTKISLEEFCTITKRHYKAAKSMKDKIISSPEKVALLRENGQTLK